MDTWAAETVLKKKCLHPDIFLEIAIPFDGHNSDVPECMNIIGKADLVRVVSASRNKKAAFHERNRCIIYL